MALFNKSALCWSVLVIYENVMYRKASYKSVSNEFILFSTFLKLHNLKALICLVYTDPQSHLIVFIILLLLR